MMMKNSKRAMWLPVLAFTAGAAVLAGCGVQTDVTGVVVEKDMVGRNVMILLARGQNSEVGDIFAASSFAYITYSATDEINQQASGNTFSIYSVMDYSDRPGGSFAQATEAAWAGIYAAEKIAEDDAREGIDPATDPLIARMWLNAGLSERQLGEMFCEAVFNYGPDGGILLNNEGNYDPSQTVDADSVFRRVVTYGQKALAVADAAVAAGEATVDDWYLFDPEVIQTSAHGLLAQAYLYLEQWDLADQHAAQVPVGHVEYTHMNPEVEPNDIFLAQFGDDEISVWGTPAHLQFEGDPRVPFVHCGEFRPGVEPGGNQPASAFVNLSDNEGCFVTGGVTGEFRTENNRYPRYAQHKYLSEDADMEMVTGTEMLLIRAEVALRAGRLADFTRYINEHRAHFDLDPIAQPATAGELEYPNAEDDGWSILDRERYLDLWLEGRRYMDLRRWEHPFWFEGHHLTPDHAALLPPGARPHFCMPIPQAECTANSRLQNTASCAPIAPPGG
jgi:SusD family